MNNIPRLRTGAATLGLAALLSVGALACTDDSTDSPVLGGDASTGTPSSAVEAPTDNRHHGDHGADVQTHAAAMELVEMANATHIAAISGDWSSPPTWNGDVPGTGAFVHIPAGVTVTVDTMFEPEIERIGVDGTLRFATDVDTELKVDTLVTTPSGTLEVGTPDQPVADDAVASIQFADDGPIDRSQDPSLISRGALLHGTTVVQGGDVTHRTTVASFPRAGDTSIEVRGPLVGWDAGDEVVITGTDGPTSDELRIITSVEGTTVQFADPLQRDHVPPADDLELYVANLTRNVQFSSENSQIDRRGHVMVMHTLDAQIRGARFTDMGRTDKSREPEDFAFDDVDPGAVSWDGSFEKLGGTNVRGRYTVHVHRGGADPRSTPAVIADSVVTGDPGWAFTNHSSHVDFLRNVAYDNAGAGFFTEAGDEVGRWVDNIAIRTVMPTFVLDDAGAIDPDLRSDRQDFGIDGDGFWFQGNRIDVIGNVSAGASAHGIIWWSESLAEADLGRAARVDVATLPDPSLVPDRDQIEVWWAPLGEVRDNTAYGSIVGVRARYIHGASYLNDPLAPPAAYIDSLEPTIDGIVTWNVRDGVLMNYNERLNLRNIRAIGIAEPFRHNYGHTAAVGVGLDVNNTETFGPGSVENVDLRNFEVGFLAPRHGLWTVRNLTTAATTDVLIHDPVHSERSLEMENITFASLSGTDLDSRNISRRNLVLAYDYAGDGDGVDPDTAEEGPTGERQLADRVTWDGLGLFSAASDSTPADAQTHPQVINGLVGAAAPVPTITHVPGFGAFGDDVDDEEDDEDRDDSEGDRDDEEFESVDELIEQTLADLRAVLVTADEETLEELVEWCGSEELEADDPFALVCVAQSTNGELGSVDDVEDDPFDALDQIVDRLVDRLEEHESAMEELLDRCESEDSDETWTLICSIVTADGEGDEGDDTDDDE